MKKKIKEALKQGHKKLGLSDEVFERVAASVETFITDESAIEGFVNSESTLSLLRSYQSINDKVRDLERFVPKPNNTPKVDEPDTGNNPPEPKPQGLDVDALVERLNAAWEQKLQPLQEKLNAFETAKSAELAVKSAQEKFFADAWVNGYPELRDAAWQQAMDVYEDTERKYTAEQLHEKAMKYFKPLAKAKGLDITQPFQSDGGAGTDPKEADAAFAAEIRKALGKEE